ncbi:hypothetical protein [Candidatus Poriferisodalis sp.]|uniref:hypothetical protein n=1 Tax=Candidatus Poriferisodalis sp. TaxID=3101277 RepID=UPI003AF5238E
MSIRASMARATDVLRRSAAAAGVTALLAGAACSGVSPRTESPEVPSRAGSVPAITAQVSSADTTVPSSTTAPLRLAAGDPVSARPPATVTRVVFETVPEPAVHHSLRVPQGDGDVKGPLFDIDRASSQSPQEREAAGTILDLCRLEDALVAEHWPYEVPEMGELSPQERQQLARSLLGRDCRGAEIALAEPLLGFWASRYRVFGTHGLGGTFFRTRGEAAAWYEQHAAAQQVRYENTLAPDAELYGSFGYPIEYSGRDNPVDEVRVLAGTVSATGGVLRGLVRNWSRTMWAYRVKVEAGGQGFSWPLSIQPGEAAPFEIDGWDGPSDPSQRDISVVADMSNDADISRAWWMLPYPQVIEPGAWYRPPPREVLDELPPDAERLVSAGAFYNSYNDPDSHPSLHGELAENLDFELALFVAFLGDDGTVADVVASTPYDRGRRLFAPPGGVLPPGAEYSVDSYGERDGRVNYRPFVVRRFPVPELGVREVHVLFGGTAVDRWVMWIGADHGAPAS